MFLLLLYNIPVIRMHGSVDELSVAHPSSIPPMMASGGKLHLFECGGNIGKLFNVVMVT